MNPIWPRVILAKSARPALRSDAIVYSICERNSHDVI